MSTAQLIEVEARQNPRFRPATHWSDPKWDQATQLHDWRNWVPDVVMARWDGLADEAKVVAWIMAEQASNPLVALPH